MSPSLIRSHRRVHPSSGFRMGHSPFIPVCGRAFLMPFDVLKERVRKRNTLRANPQGNDENRKPDREIPGAPRRQFSTRRFGLC